MAYRKLGRESRIRRSILAGLTKDVINHGYVVTTEARAKEARKFVDKMVTYGKKGTLISRRQALAFLHNDKDVVNKVKSTFNDAIAKIESSYLEMGFDSIEKYGSLIHHIQSEHKPFLSFVNYSYHT